jgi:hypothetical protein
VAVGLVNTERCKEMIRGDWRPHQCSRKAVTDDGYCRQHSPAKKAERKAQAEAKYEEGRLKRQMFHEQAARLRAEVYAVTGMDHSVTIAYSVAFGPMPGAVVVDVDALEILIKKAAR